MTRSFCRNWLLLLAGLLCFPPEIAHAQPVPSKAPSSTHIYPAGGRRGTKLDVLVGAECIPPLTRFRMFGRGVTLRSQGFDKTLGSELLTERVDAPHEPSPRRRPLTVPITIPREWKSSLSIDKDATLGMAYWRLSCAQGGTELRPFVVGDWPEFIETESNSTPQTAERITLPVTVNGRIYGERDNDYFRFAANRGDVVVCEVLAARLKSRLDPIVEILDADGRPVPTETTYVGRDPVLAFRAESNGDYLLRIANVSHHGDAAHVYRVNISTRPFVRSCFPTSGQAGSEREIEFRLMTGTREARVVKRRVKFPLDAKRQAGGSLQYRLQTDGTTAANSVAFDVVSENVNTARRGIRKNSDAIPTLTLPVRVDGRLATRDDQHWFRFTAKKGVNYTILCDAPPVGSSAMPTLLLASTTAFQGRRATTTGATRRPWKAVVPLQRAVENGDNACRIEWECPADGEYRIRVRDQQFGAKGGPEFLYRLTVRQARPDFELFVDSEFVNVPQGQTIHVPIYVKRYGGFDDPVTLHFEGLPEGVKAESELISGKRSRFEIAISAKKSAPSQDAVFRIIGRGRAGLTKLEHAAVTKSLLRSRIYLTVQHLPVFRLFCFEAYQYAHRGSVFRYPMTIQRLDGFKGPVTLQVGDRQNRDMDGIEIGTVNVPPGTTETIVPIYLPETMHINEQSQSQLYTQGYARFTDEHGRRQAMLVLSEKRNMLRTLPPVVKLKAVNETVKARPGETVTIPLRLERTTNFSGAMTVELRDQGGKPGFVSKPVRFKKGESLASVSVRLPESFSAKSAMLTFRGTGTMEDGTTIISETRVTVRVQK
jgi:hypothetical protein